MLWNGSFGYEIGHYNDTYVVNLENKTCACGAWILSGIPCCHVVCAINDRQEQLEDYISEWYSKDTYLRSYTYMMSTLNGEKFWPECIEPPTKPPPFKKMPGRPKISRRKEEYEIGSNGRLIKRGRQVTYQHCFGKDHNKATCPVRKSIEKAEATSISKRPDKSQVILNTLFMK